MGNDQGSSSYDCSDPPKNPSSPRNQENSPSENTSVINNTSDFAFDGEEVTVTGCINILLRNPMPPSPPILPPPPTISPFTRARIIRMLAEQNIVGDHHEILQVVARTIADFHPYLMKDDTITIPQSAQISITQYTEETFIDAFAGGDWDHNIEIPIDIVDDDQMSQETGEMFYDASSEEEDDPPIEFVDDDDMTYEELLALEATYGLPEAIISRHLINEEYMYKTSEHEESCRICLEVYEDGDNTSKLECGDRFHYDCISQWLALKNLCPLCRRTGLCP